MSKPVQPPTPAETRRTAHLVPPRTDGQISADVDTMAHYAITRVPAHRFHYASYIYTSLADAVTQARRDELRESTVGG
jgi:hypothetical protein